MFKYLFLGLSLVSLTFADSYIIQNVPVKYSNKTTKYVYQQTPYQSCYDENIYSNSNYRHRHHRDNNYIGLDTIIGSVAGIALGNQIGHGNGRATAKVIGGITGGYIANNMRNNNSNSNERIIHKRKNCVTKYKNEKVKVFSGYKNYFDLNGKLEYKVSSKKLYEVPVKISYSW